MTAAVVYHLQQTRTSSQWESFRLRLHFCVAFFYTQFVEPRESCIHQVAPCVVRFVFNAEFFARGFDHWRNVVKVAVIQAREQVVFNLVIQSIRKQMPRQGS